MISTVRSADKKVGDGTNLLLLLPLGAQTLTSLLLLLEELSLLVSGLGSLGLDEVGIVNSLGDLKREDVMIGCKNNTSERSASRHIR